MSFFASIRFKILAAVLALALSFGLALFFVGKDLYANYKELEIARCRSLVEEETGDLAAIIQSLHANVLELALMGELLLPMRPEQRDKLGGHAVLRNFSIDKNATGGGIWYLPRLFDAKRELACFYALRKDGATALDPGFASQEYYYPGQKWYVEAMRAFARAGSGAGEMVVWSPAYVDAAGARQLMTTASAAIIDSGGKVAGLATIDWSLEDIAREMAAIRPAPGSISVFADVEHDAILSLSGQGSGNDALARPLASLAWFEANAPLERRLEINGEAYLSFARKFANGMMVVVNVPEAELFHSLRRGLVLALFSLFFALLLAAALAWALLDRFISKPVTGLCRAAAAVGAGNLDARFAGASKDELGALANAFAAMTASLKKQIAQIEAITEEKSRIDAELGIAREIQAAMLPGGFPSRKDCAIFAIMRPAREVGGDFYDFFFIDADHLAVAMSDVSGKGVPAALFMTIAKTIIRSSVSDCANPGAALAAANARLCENNSACMFVTAFLGVLDLRSGIFCYANAGHNPFYWREPGASFKRASLAPALPLGVMPAVKYASRQFSLPAGATIFFYTDGVTDAVDPAGDFLGAAGLERALSSGASCLPSDLGGFIDGIMARITNFSQGSRQNDDITMLALSWFGEGGAENKAQRAEAARFHSKRILPANAQALPELMSMLETALAAGAFTEQQRMRFCVAAEEIFVNIANYAYANPGQSGEVEIEFEVSGPPCAMRLTFTDWGKAFNPLEQPAPDIELAAQDRNPGGLGIFLAAKGASSIQYQREDGKNVLTLILLSDRRDRKERI